jgi:DNA polymerase III sliding clamp (beta) subunit (PCNA family)
MKFTIQKRFIRKALRQLAPISSRHCRKDFVLLDLVMLEAKAGRVYIYSSNGYLFARCEITKDADAMLEVTENGAVTLTASVLTKIVDSIGGTRHEDFALSFSTEKVEDSEVLVVRDTTHPERDRFASMPIIKLDDPSAIRETFNFANFKTNYCKFESAFFSRGVSAVSNYTAEINWRPYYFMVCIHLLPTETRFVCGNGNRFGIFTVDQIVGNIKEDVLLNVPANQLHLALPLIEDSNTLEMGYNDNQCYLRPSNEFDIIIKGIPSETYVPYHKLLYGQDEAKLVIDFETQELVDTSAFVGSVKDKDVEKKKIFAYEIEFAKDGNHAVFEVKDNKYKCKTKTDCKVYVLNDTGVFHGRFACQYLAEIAAACGASNLRIYAKTADDLVIAIIGDVEIKEKDEQGVPIFKEKTDGHTSMRFFFAPLKPQQEVEEEAEEEGN